MGWQLQGNRQQATGNSGLAVCQAVEQIFKGCSRDFRRTGGEYLFTEAETHKAGLALVLPAPKQSFGHQSCSLAVRKPCISSECLVKRPP